MALSAARDTPKYGETSVVDLWPIPVAEGEKIWGGSIVCIESGYAISGDGTKNLVCAGRAEATVDNTDGDDGDVTVVVRRGTFGWDNSASGDAIAQADVGNVCYVANDHAVAKTSNSGVRGPAGRIVKIESGQVYVEMLEAVSTAAQYDVTIPDDLTVTDDLTVSDDLSVGGDATVTGTLAAGASTLASATVTGAATVGTTLGVTGAATVGSAVVTAGATVGTTLGVTGAATLGSAVVTAGATVGTTLGVTGAATLGSAVITAGATVGTTLGVTGAATLGSAVVTASATVGTTLGVTGASTLAAVGCTTLSASGAITSAVPSIRPGTTGITAFAGGGQGSATALTAEVNFVTVVATANDSVLLPVAALGKRIVVYNLDAADSLDIYPVSGSAIDALGADAPYQLAGGGCREFWGQSATQWRSKS